jgi:hypothetical protein
VFDDLREMRKLIADSEGIAPFVVFNDATLMGMAKGRPQQEEELLDIPGVSKIKMERYGKEFLDVLAKYPPAEKPVSVRESLSDARMEEFVAEMKQAGARLSHHALGLILTGSDAASLGARERNLSFYGKLQRKTRLSDIRDRLKEYFEKNIYKDVKEEVESFFSAETYIHLADDERQNLEALICSIPMQRTAESLTPVMADIRKTYSRSHEPWSYEEMEAFKTAVQKTNDIAFLSALFRRSPGAIRGIYEQLLKRKMMQDEDSMLLHGEDQQS